jgi:hypothetical protein
MTDPSRESVEGKAEAEPGRLTVGLFLRSLDFSDLLVVLGWASLTAAGFLFHLAGGLVILGAGLALIGVRAGRAA